MYLKLKPSILSVPLKNNKKTMCKKIFFFKNGLSKNKFLQLFFASFLLNSRFYQLAQKTRHKISAKIDFSKKKKAFQKYFLQFETLPYLYFLIILFINNGNSFNQHDKNSNTKF